MKKAAARNAFEPESDEHFASIVGYTAGGFPYGMTWEDLEEEGHPGSHPSMPDDDFDLFYDGYLAADTDDLTVEDQFELGRRQRKR